MVEWIEFSLFTLRWREKVLVLCFSHITFRLISLSRTARVQDLFIRAKHLFVAAKRCVIRVDGHHVAGATGSASAGSAITLRAGDDRSVPSHLCKRCSSQLSLTGHLNRGIHGVFEIVRVVSRGFVSIAEVHAIMARAHFA